MAPPGTPSSYCGNFMNVHGIATYFIPLGSWRQAQQPQKSRIGICPAVVEESALE